LIYLTAPRGGRAALRDYLFFRLSGFKKIIGIPFTRDMQECRQIAYDSTNGPIVEQECRRLARCVQELGPINVDDRSVWDLKLTERELDRGREARLLLGSRRIIAINMGGKLKQNDWGSINWSVLLSRLQQSYADAGLLILGAADDYRRAEDLSSVWSEQRVNLCGRLSPRESAAAVMDSTIFVGHDSGPIHLASCMGVTCVGLYGNVNKPGRWHPPGSQHQIIHRMQGIQAITVDEVEAAVRKVMSQRSI
jgi:ADP-heptose:LPS heptosyltransferase